MAFEEWIEEDPVVFNNRVKVSDIITYRDSDGHEHIWAYIDSDDYYSAGLYDVYDYDLERFRLMARFLEVNQ